MNGPLLALAFSLLGPPVLPPTPGGSAPTEAPPASASPAPAEDSEVVEAELSPSERSRLRAAEATRRRNGETELPPATAEEIAALASPPSAAPDPSPEAGGREARAPGDRPERAPSDDGSALLLRTATPEQDPERLTYRRRPKPPERTAAFVFGYRQFEIRDALRRRQSWHFASVEVTPLRRYVRLNFLTEFGWEGGQAARGGDRADFMLLQKGGLGVQYPHWVSPFVEFQGGAGVARQEIFDRNQFVFVYTLGVDVGAQWAVTKWLFLHGALGWIRPVLRQPQESVYFDRFAFKFGIGF